MGITDWRELHVNWYGTEAVPFTFVTRKPHTLKKIYVNFLKTIAKTLENHGEM